MKRVILQGEDGKRFGAALANTFFLRLRGLLGRDVKELGGLLIVPCNQIHCIGMGYPIDAVYLDREGRVLKTEAAIPVGKVCKTVKGGRAVLELPAGSAGEYGFTEGSVWKYEA